MVIFFIPGKHYAAPDKCLCRPARYLVVPSKWFGGPHECFAAPWEY
jgi:hypothetical protein